jgi:hypothetical protein
MSETKTPLSADEQKYFDSGGDDGAAAAPEGAAPAAEPVEPAEPAAPPEQDRMVPRAALLEERKARQAHAAEIAKLREQNARYEERMQVFRELQAAEKPQAGLPDITTDPQGYVEYLGRQQAEIQAQQQRDAAEREQHAQIRQLQKWATGYEVEFKKSTPDWTLAMDHLRASGTAELLAQGISPEQVQAGLDAYVLRVAWDARQSGANPAERLYNIAKTRGYTKPADTSTQSSVEQQADAISRGQRLAAGAPGSGSAGGADVTTEWLANAQPREFNAFVAKYPAKARQLMGE